MMQIKESDIRFESFSGSGPGGQYRNRHANCVRAIHIPTGVIATATSERSQRQNKAAAIENLRAKLAQIRDDALAAAKRSRRDSKPAPSFGGVAIRTYRMGGPDSGVVDHRTGFKAGLDFIKRGRIDGAISSFLRSPYNA